MKGQQNDLDMIEKQSTKLEETMAQMKQVRQDTNDSVEKVRAATTLSWCLNYIIFKITAHKNEIEKLVTRQKAQDAEHAKQMDTKKFLIGKLKEERVKLQEENKKLKNQMVEESSGKKEMMGKILELEENNEKLKKEIKAKRVAKVLISNFENACHFLHSNL